MVVPSERTRGNGHKFKPKFILNAGRLHREVVESPSVVVVLKTTKGHEHGQPAAVGQGLD